MMTTLQDVLDNKDLYSAEVVSLATMLDTMDKAYSGYLGDFAKQTYISAGGLGITFKEATDAIAGIANVRESLQKATQKALELILIGAIVQESKKIALEKQQEV